MIMNTSAVKLYYFSKKFQIESFLGNFLMTLIFFSKKFNFARETKQETKPRHWCNLKLLLYRTPQHVCKFVILIYSYYYANYDPY
jgi:hypothetical protein